MEAAQFSAAEQAILYYSTEQYRKQSEDKSFKNNYVRKTWPILICPPKCQTTAKKSSRSGSRNTFWLMVLFSGVFLSNKQDTPPKKIPLSSHSAQITAKDVKCFSLCISPSSACYSAAQSVSKIFVLESFHLDLTGFL